MVERRLPLSASDETVLDANGAGAVELKPLAYNETWLVTSVATKVTSTAVAPSETEFNVYNSGVFIDGTQDGNLNSSGLYEIVHTNQPIRGEWTGGDSGAVAQMRLGGIRILS